MMQLFFNTHSIPRTTSRKEWNRIWRHKRLLERDCKNILEQRIKNLRQDNLPDKIKEDLLNLVVNPPVVVFP